MKKRYGIIGCGMMGQEHLRNISLIDDALTYAVYEPNPNMRKMAKALAPEAKFHDSLNKILSDENIDCWLIVSPNHLHMDQLEQLANVPHKPILVEKPLFTDINHLERIKHFLAKYTAPVWVAMEYRYMPPIAELITQQKNVTGDIKMLSIREHRFPFLPKVDNWNRFNKNSGGTFVEKCCHFFDLMRLITKSNPTKIMASGGQAVNHLKEKYSGLVPDIWDHGYVIVEFENNIRAMLELCMFAEGAKYQEEISITGDTGKIEAFVPGPARFWPKKLGAPPIPKIVVSPRDKAGLREFDVPVDEMILEAGDHNGSTFYQHQKFMRVVDGHQSPEVTLNDGIWAVRMGNAAQVSAETGKVVNF